MKTQTIKNLVLTVAAVGCFTAMVSNVQATIVTTKCETPVVDCYKPVPCPPCPPPCPPPVPKITSVPEPSTIVAGALLLLPFGVSTMRILRRHKSQQ